MSSTPSKSSLEGCVLRLMTPLDVPDVYALEVACFDDPWTKEAFEAECHNHLARYYLLVHHETIIGYCGLWRVVDEGHITNLCIGPEWRKRGLGEWMMRQVFEAARKEDIVNITLEVRVSNEKAIYLYEKLGFKRAGVRKRYYENNGEDALIMWISI